LKAQLESAVNQRNESIKNIGMIKADLESKLRDSDGRSKKLEENLAIQTNEFNQLQKRSDETISEIKRQLNESIRKEEMLKKQCEQVANELKERKQVYDELRLENTELLSLQNELKKATLSYTEERDKSMKFENEVVVKQAELE
jgi:chromosome segregation ATPase